MENTTVAVNTTQYTCNWCDPDPRGDLPATYTVTANGWTDYACLEHVREYFPELLPAGEATDPSDAVIERARGGYREWAARPWYVKAWDRVRSECGYVAFRLGGGK